MLKKLVQECKNRFPWTNSRNDQRHFQVPTQIPLALFPARCSPSPPVCLASCLPSCLASCFPSCPPTSVPWSVRCASKHQAHLSTISQHRERIERLRRVVVAGSSWPGRRGRLRRESVGFLRQIMRFVEGLVEYPPLGLRAVQEMGSPVQHCPVPEESCPFSGPTPATVVLQRRCFTVAVSPPLFFRRCFTVAVSTRLSRRDWQDGIVKA